jgi:hypothetical protein
MRAALYVKLKVTPAVVPGCFVRGPGGVGAIRRTPFFRTSGLLSPCNLIRSCYFCNFLYEKKGQGEYIVKLDLSIVSIA